MKNPYAPTRSFIRNSRHGLMVMGLMAAALHGHAQLSLTAPGTPQAIDFDNTVAGVSNGAWAGNGFQPVPTAGQLSSNAFSSYGWNSGALNLGGTQTTSGTDYRRGSTAPGNAPVLVGGLWSFGGPGITGRALGIQPSTGDLVPGFIGLRIQNNTGVNLTAFDIAFNLFYRNDQPRATSFELRYSSDNTTFTAIPAVNVVSPAAAVGTTWVPNLRNTTITNLNIVPGGYLYLRWYSDDAGGTGNRDEFALDDISVTGHVNTSVAIIGSAASVTETVGTFPIPAAIVNPDPVNPTTVDLVLISGPADRVGNFTTQTLTFPAGSAANALATINITDNGSCDGTATLVFELQNVAGGTPPAAISPQPSQFTLTITDDNVSPVSHRQWFDSDPLDQWPIVSGSGSITTLSGATDVPANQRILSGTSSWQQSDGTASLELAPIDVQDWQGTVLSARLSSPSVSATNDGVDIADSIVFYVSLNGAPFSAVPDIRVSGSPTGNARWGFATGAGIASTTAGVPAQYNPAGPGLRTTDGYSTVRILIPDGTTTVALRIHARNNSWHERWCVDNISLTGTLCSQVYFSRANGSQNTATWSTSRTGSPAPAVPSFTKNATAVVQATHVVTTTSAATINLLNLDIETGSTLNLTGATDVRIHGTNLNVNGTLNASDATVSFLGTAPSTLTGSQTATVFGLVVDGPAVTQQLNTLRIRGSLDILSGGYNVNNNGVPARSLTLVSEASGTGRLGPVVAPATFSGSIVMERYVPAGATNWRLISAATLNNTLSSLEDDFLTAGYPGSHFPNFDSPVGSGIPWPSIRTYTESNPGPTLNDGLIGVTGDNMVMAPGQGFMAWAGTTFNTTAAFTIDLRSAPHIGAPAITLPMTYTNNGAPSVDGWNLVGNPLPSPIDFSLVSRGADVENFYYVFNPATGNNAIWDEALGLSIPSGALNGNIQSCQGFWLKANGPAVTTQVEEADKVLDRSGGGLFGGEQDGDSPLFRLVIGSTLNEYIDEALIHFGVGAPEMGEYDIVKFPLSHPDAPRIQSESSDGQDLMLNAFGAPGTDVTIPVSVQVSVDGAYTIRMHGAEGVLGVSCLVLEDLVTGTSTVLGEGTEYSFQASATDAAAPARFLIHASAAVHHAFTDATCAGVADGTATITGSGDGPWNITLMNAFGSPIAEYPNSTGAVTIDELAAGNYAIAIDGNGACGQLVHNFTITQPAPLAASATATPATCATAEDAAVGVTAQGGVSPYTYTWNNGATTPTLEGVGAGTYEVVLTDAQGCSLAPVSVTVQALEGPTASFLVSQTQLNVGDTLRVFNTGTYGTAYDWAFGDGTTSTESEPEHSYAQPGTYTVELTIWDGTCSATTTHTVEVSIAQGIADGAAAQGLRAWTNGTDFILEGPVATGGRANLDILDATGRLLRSVQLTPNGRTLVPANGLPNGVYFLRVQEAGAQHTYRVPLLR